MPKVDLEQGSESWLKWRQGLITASNAPALLGKHKYGKTPTKLWNEMMGFSKPQQVNWAMQRGTMMEPKIRQMFIDLTGIWIEPACYEHYKYPFLGASLDGVNEHERIVAEIKTGSKELYECVRDGKPLRDDYYIQVQHQLESCAEFEPQVNYLIVQNPEDENMIAYRAYYRDDALIHAIVSSSERFYYDHVLTKTPPKASGSDRTVRTDKRLKEIADRLNYIKALEEEKKNLKEEAKTLCDGRSADFFGWSLVRSVASTGVDYKKACVDHGIDLDKYKRPEVEKYILRPQGNGRS